MKKKILSAVKILLFLGIGVLFIWLFYWSLEQKQIKISEILDSFRNASYGWVFIAIFFGLLSHILRTLRWIQMITPMGYKPRFLNVCMALMIGYFANLAVPRLGEVSRCTVLAKYEGVPFQKGFGTVVTERVLDIITFLVLFFINLFIQYSSISQYVIKEIYHPLQAKFSFLGHGYIMYGLICAFVILIVLFFILRKRLRQYKLYQKVANIFKGFAEGLKSLARIKNPLLFILYTVLIWVMYFFMTYLCFFSIKELAGLSPLAGFSVLVFGTIGVMVSPGGLGAYPLIVTNIIGIYDTQNIKQSGALAWLIWSAQTVSLIFAGIVSLIVLPLYNRNQNGKVRGPETENIQSRVPGQ